MGRGPVHGPPDQYNAGVSASSAPEPSRAVRPLSDSARLAALSRAAIAITAELSVDRVLQTIADAARELIGSRYCALGVSDSQGRILQFLTSGISAEQRAAIGPLPRGLGLLGVLIHDGRPLRVPSIADDPRSVGFPPNHPPMTALLGVPIVAHGQVLGDLYLTDRLDGEPFSELDEQLATLLAGHAAVAIQNARLHARLQDLAIHEERERIMRDLHDGIIQSLFAVGLSIQLTLDLVEGSPSEARGRLERAVVDLDSVMADVRRYILSLGRTESGPRDGLEARLRRIVAEFQSATVMQIQLSVSPELGGAQLGERTIEHLLQIAHEALANSVKHAGGDAAAIRVEQSDGRVLLTVWDNGVGFQPARARARGQRGLRNMRARTRALGGTLRISSRTDEGTRVTVSIPSAGARGQGEAAVGTR